MNSRLLAIALLYGAITAPPALAHASLMTAVPEPGAVIPSGDVAIELRFDSRLDPKFSKLSILDANGAEKALTPETAGATTLLRAQAEGLARGGYILRWRVLSVDGHANQGDIKFRVSG